MASKTLTIDKAKTLVQQAWWTGVNAVNGYDLVAAELSKNNDSNITHVIAIGKAASAMMLAAYDTLEPFHGLVVTKYNHCDQRLKNLGNVEVFEAAHPIPDPNSLLAGERLVDFIDSIESDENLLVLVSGGASSLAEKLPAGMSLSDLQSLNEKMLSQQKTIGQINIKRSQVSMIKKAKLLNRCKASSIAILAISDVEGDDISVIGSGIGACDLPNSTQKIIGSNKVARQAICDFFKDNNMTVAHESESLYGDLYLTAQKISRTISEGDEGAYVFGGEPTIQLPQDPGIGGRNQSLALAVAKQIKGESNIIVLVAGSDGTDGPTNAAGGLVDSDTFDRELGAQKALDRADAGSYLEQVDSLFLCGPTGTNVMDLVVALKI